MSSLPHAAGVSLRELLADDLTVRPRDVRAKSITHDARSVQAGDVFVAVVSAEDDGHDVAADAARRGATAIICERLLPVFGVPQFVVSDSRAAYGRVCQALVGNPSQQLKVIGVTGTSGKTTVARLMSSIFDAHGARTGLIDSLGSWDGSDCRSASDGELSPPTLARTLARIEAHGLTHAILEVSSQALCQSALAGVELHAACITHVGRDHLDWHGTLENYRRAKRRILDHLSVKGVAILNADCQESMRILSTLNQPALTIGLKKPAEITAQIIEQHVNEQIFVLTAGDDSVGVRTAIIGDHHVYNCLSAAATCLAYGIELTTIARGLEAVDSLPGRMERVVCGDGYSVYVDAAKSPDTLRACLRASRQVTSGRVICVFGADENAAREQRKALGRVAGALADVSVITSSEPRSKGRRDNSRDIVHGFANPRKAHVILDRGEAIAWALEQASDGDTVVVAGMGDRLHAAAAANELPCDDCDMVRQILSGQYRTAAPHRIAA
ncbi:MAG TPA: UDP-N-acetylmuramoyl-L-alanyl-D-glutamate--2,6-diaminopimelate ligase [Lacipirellulaceae bacterium]